MHDDVVTTPKVTREIGRRARISSWIAVERNLNFSERQVDRLRVHRRRHLAENFCRGNVFSRFPRRRQKIIVACEGMAKSTANIRSFIYGTIAWQIKSGSRDSDHRPCRLRRWTVAIDKIKTKHKYAC